MSKESRLIKNTFILLIGIVGTKLVNFILLPFLTAWLSVEEYGSIDVFLTVVSMIVPICSLQIEQAIFRFLIDDKSEDEEKITVSSSVIFVFLILILIDISVLLYYLFNRKFLLLIYLLAINLQVVYIVIQQIIRGKGYNSTYTINSIIFAIATLVGCVIFIKYLKLGTFGYIYSYCFANLIAITYMIFKSNVMNLISFSCFNFCRTINMLKYSVPMILNNVSWWILNASDKLILNYFVGTNANGIYAAAGKIPGLITSVFSVFQMAWQESTSREQNDKGLAEFYSNVFRSLYVILSYAVILILLLSKILFPLLINIKFRESFFHVPILLIGLFFLCLAQFYGGIFVGLHNSNELGWTSAVAAIINLLVNLVLVNIFDIYAASVSTLIAYLVLFIIRLFNTRKVVDIKYNFKEILVVSATIIISFIATYIFDIYIQILILLIISFIFWRLFKDIIFSFVTMVLKRRI